MDSTQNPGGGAVTFTPPKTVHSPNVIGQLFSDTATDASANLQAAIDSAAAAWGDEILLPRNVLYGSIKMQPRVALRGKHRGATLLRALPGQAAPILDYATYDAFHTKVSNLRLDGNYIYGRTDGQVQGTCRAIDMRSSNSDAWANPFPQAAAAPDWPPVQANFAGKWDNPINQLEDLFITNCGGDYAVVFGTNQRGTVARALHIEECLGVAVLIACTDSHFDTLDCGACGDGILITGAVNKLINCKSWYHGVLAGYNNGLGDGYRLALPGAQLIGGNHLTDCESQDNQRSGFAVVGGRANVIRGVSGGDTQAVRLGGATAVNSNDIEVMISKADRQQEAVGLILVGATGVPSQNRVRISIDAAQAEQVGFVAVQTADVNAQVMDNDFMVISGAEIAYHYSGSFAGGSTWNPDPGQGSTLWAGMTGNITVGPVNPKSHRNEMTLILTQDATGAHTVTWDASYIGAPQPAALANQKTTYKFINTRATQGVGTVTPVWQCVEIRSGW